MSDDSVVRRIVVEYGRRYVYAYLSDSNSRVLSEEVWQQPLLLDRRDAYDEAKDLYDVIYQHCQDTVLWSASPGHEGEQSDEEED